MNDPMTLLLVDDRPENLVALKAILDRPDYRVLTATSGQEALRLTLREDVVVVLLDVLMPEMDGYEVARYLKQAQRTREIPIIFLTAIATDMSQIYRAYEVGAVDYIVKPLDAEVVRRKVAVFVDLARQREQLKRQAEALRDADRREYELKLGELRLAGDRRYRKLVEGIDHAIGWTMDANLRFTFISQKAPEILGYSMQQLGEPGFWAEHLHADDRDAVLAAFRRAHADGIEQVIDHRVIAADGHGVWFHTGVSGETDTTELHGISVDISDVKRAQEEAERATHIREELLAIVAHDLRNPLGSIRTGAELLERVAGRTNDDKVKKTARTIIRATARMDHLISDLLDFALMEADRLSIEPRAIEASGLVSETLELLRPVADEKELHLEGHAGELWIRGDRDRMLQIFSNLLGNAIKFTPKGGSVSLHAERSGNDALFSISDTGPGIADDDLSRIWDRFWQRKRTSGGGIGLGLSIAKGLVEAQGGRIWARSNVGVGSTFSFTIPLTSLDEAHPPTVESGQAPERPAGSH